MSTPATTDPGAAQSEPTPDPAALAAWDAWSASTPASTSATPATPDAPVSPPAFRPPSTDPGRANANVVGERRGWERWALAALLVLTAALYLWGLDRNGWANAYYSAAAQAGGDSWTAWFFGGLDSANSITVDKPPASLWLMGLSVRLFGLSTWSILVPQALLGVATAGVLYAAVRRWFGAPAGLIAGAVLALTPVATLMFRFNNPDALLVFLLVCGAWAMGRATERGSLRWIMLAGGFVGMAFLAKMMQAFLVLPGFVAMYAVAAPIGWRRRVGHLLASLAAMALAGGWWIAVVELWPASARPYVGGSQANSVVELLLGYNGFGRLTGNETGSVVPGGGAASGGMWGETGWDRLLSSSYGGQVAWLVPAALVMIVVLLWVSRRAPRTDLTRAAALLWGGWLLVTAAVISYGQGIIHEYYTVALAPAIGALVGIGAVELWARRGQLWARVVAAAVVAGSACWAAALLGRSPAFVPWLADVVLVGGLCAAALILVAPLLPAASRRVALAAGAALALLTVLAGPAAYSMETTLTPASGSLPSAGPAVPGGRGGPGGGPGGFPGGGQLLAPPGGATGQLPGFPSGPLPGSPGDGQPLGTTQVPGATSTPGTAPGGTGGSLLQGSDPGEALTAALLADADSYTWVAAAVGANTAAGYQLAAQEPVMAIGGFNGSDPSPTLVQFQAYVAEGGIHWFIASGGGPGGGQMGGSDVATQITAWVTETFPATTVDGVTLYDLTGTTSAPSGTGDSSTTSA